jgi:hypothetical protein
MVQSGGGAGNSAMPAPHGNLRLDALRGREKACGRAIDNFLEFGCGLGTLM